MLDYLILIVTALLALIATLLNTEKNEPEKRKSIFKQPTGAGWLVVILLLGLTTFQLVAKQKEDRETKEKFARAEQSRLRDSFHIRQMVMKDSLDSISWKKQFNLLNDLHRRECTQLLATTKIDRSTDMLLNPILPTLFCFRIIVPFKIPHLQNAMNQVFRQKDSIEQLLIRRPYQATTLIGPRFSDKKIESYYLDTNSIYSHREINEIICRHIIEGFHVYLYDHKPNMKHHDENFQLLFKASALIPEEILKFQQFRFFFRNTVLNFRDSAIHLELFFKGIPVFNNGQILGFQDLLNKYMLFENWNAWQRYSRLKSVVMYYGKEYERIMPIKFLPTDEILTTTRSPTRYSYLYEIKQSDIVQKQTLYERLR